MKVGYFAWRIRNWGLIYLNSQARIGHLNKGSVNLVGYLMVLRVRSVSDIVLRLRWQHNHHPSRYPVINPYSGFLTNAKPKVSHLLGIKATIAGRVVNWKLPAVHALGVGKHSCSFCMAGSLPPLGTYNGDFSTLMKRTWCVSPSSARISAWHAQLPLAPWAGVIPTMWLYTRPGG